MQEKQRLNVRMILGFVLLIWTIEGVNLLVDHNLSRWGILPRTVSGLRGIPLSPFLHGSVSHVMLNTVPFVILGGLVALRGPQVFIGVSLAVVFLGGTALWLVGRLSYHIGASGLIFGYFGYLVARAWYERSLTAILIALVTLGLYGGLIWGILPTRRYISWEGHLCGLLAGVLVARFSPAPFDRSRA